MLKNVCVRGWQKPKQYSLQRLRLIVVVVVVAAAAVVVSRFKAGIDAFTIIGTIVL
jgi:hypothetical protein